ncbi:hypothetical protein U0026_04620 [Kluyvera intermedia]|uniref:hypothetical protein n=1 Tax=Kluyvera intermedia TaxID=61648 RepID=UPI000F84BA8B|nr:hypothetical protein [Kluyvera intermedia]WQD30581.1 hypothetical protein U0026_04620 [Kluyvera intermedia]
MIAGQRCQAGRVKDMDFIAALYGFVMDILLSDRDLNRSAPSKYPVTHALLFINGQIHMDYLDI